MLTAAFARELGARSFGTALAALLAATPGVWYVIDHQFAMNAFEPLFATGCAFVLLRMIKTRNPKLWLAFGVLAGLGLENKYSIAVFAFALLAGLLLTEQRKLLFTPWLFFAGGGVALLIFFPNLVWNVQHHWPFLELMRNIRASGRDVVLSPGAFVAQQILLMTPSSLPFWLGGVLFYLFFSPRDAIPRLRVGIPDCNRLFSSGTWQALLFCAGLPASSAAGGVATEVFLLRRFEMRPRLRSVLEVAAFVWLVVGLAPLLPVVLPVLPVDAYLRYQEHLPFEVPRSEHSHIAAALPQHYADQFGWPEMVGTVARVYYSLPEEQRRKTAIYTDNYGEAGAIDFFGRQYGLPKAICPHQSYFLWGPRNYTGEIMILIGSAHAEEAKRFFESAEIAATLDNPYAIPNENRPILLCRGLKMNLQTLWPELEKWN